MEENIYSHHHFMFPFRWDILPKSFGVSDIKENISFDERTDLRSLPDSFGKWKRHSFSFHSRTAELLPKGFNEFTYFHRFVSKAIYDYPYNWKRNRGELKYYEYDIKEDSSYRINILEEKEKISLNLRVDGISLHMYHTGVGVLSFDLSNVLETQAGPKTILKINEFGRRIYPQFMAENGNMGCKHTFLADSIELDIEETPIEEDFNWYHKYNIDLTPSNPGRMPSHITSLFDDDFIFDLSGTLERNKILLTKITDDRMFFLSWFGNDDLSKQMADDFKESRTYTHDWWYAYIFGDKVEGTSIANPLLQKEQLKSHTYGRWVGEGTLYGVSRDSFVCITDYGGFARDFLRVHMQSIYYNLMVLCLVQRTSILKFTAEVANLTDLAQIKEDKKLIVNIKEIYKNYIEFTNKIYFREVTSQIQGIELYDKIQKVMNIKEEIKDLDKEINELHQYVSLLQDGERNEEAAKLNKLAIFLVPFTIVTGIMGANIFGEKSFITEWDNWEIWLAVGIGCLFSLVISSLIYLYFKLKKK